MTERAPATTARRGWAPRTSKIVRGVFLTLGLVVFLEANPDPGTTTLALIGATLAVMAGGVYGVILEREVARERRLTTRESLAVVEDYLYVLPGAIPAVAAFVAAWLGLVDPETATYLALGLGILLLGLLGFLAGRSSGRPLARCLVMSVETALFGLVALLITVVVRLT